MVNVSTEIDLSHLHDVLLAQLFLALTEECEFSEGRSRVAYGLQPASQKRLGQLE